MVFKMVKNLHIEPFNGSSLLIINFNKISILTIKIVLKMYLTQFFYCITYSFPQDIFISVEGSHQRSKKAEVTPVSFNAWQMH